MEVDRVRFAGVRSPQEDDVRLLDLAVRARSAPRSEHRRQTDDAGSVSGTVTAVDVVGAERDAGELLGQIVHLVRRLRAGEEAQGLSAVRVANAAKTRRGGVEGFVPGRRTELPALANQGLGQPGIRLHRRKA